MPEESFFDEPEEQTGLRSWMNDCEFILIESPEQLKEVVDEAIELGLCALDLETTGLNNKVYDGVCQGKIVGFCLSIDGIKGYYAPINHKEGNLPEKPIITEIKRLCENCVTVFHHAKFDTEFLWTVGINVDKSSMFEDTQILVYLDNDDLAKLKGKGLKDSALRYLGMEMIEFKDLFPQSKGKKKVKIDFRFDKLHPEECVRYAASDAIVTYRLFQHLKHNIKEQPVVYKIDKALIPALRIMERNRVKIDTEYLRGLKIKVENEMQELAEKVYKIVGHQFSFTAPREIGFALFEKLKLPGGKKTKKSDQWATSEKDLEHLKDKHPVVTYILRYKSLDTLIRRYIGPLSENVDHLSEAKFQFDACRVQGGRFACPGGDPSQGYTGVNVQSTPKKREEDMPNIRKGFIARPGFKIVDIDYGGQELRIAANISREQNLLSIFKDPDPKERKPHRKLAQDVFNVKEPTPTQYAIAKSTNFQTLYGGGGKSIAQKVGIAETEGMRIQKIFFQKNPKLKAWIDHQKKFVRKHGYIKTYFGRIRRIPLAFSDQKRLVAYAERLAINAPIQGTAGDIMRIAIVNITSLIKKKEWEDDCKILLTIHDELVFEVREEKIDLIVPELIKAMSAIGGRDWEVELEVETEVGDSWSCDQQYHLGENYKEQMISDLHKERELKRSSKEETESPPDSKLDSPPESNLESQTQRPQESEEYREEKQRYLSERKVIKEPEPDNENSYKYVVSDPLLRCKVSELYEIIKKCSGEKQLVLVDERNTSLLPNDFVIKVDPEKFYEFASLRGI